MIGSLPVYASDVIGVHVRYIHLGKMFAAVVVGGFINWGCQSVKTAKSAEQAPNPTPFYGHIWK